MRRRERRVITLESSFFPLYRPNLTLTHKEYDKSMRSLISWLVRANSAGYSVEVCTSHYGYEWVELRSTQGKLKSKMALSVRVIHSLKVALLESAERRAALASEEAEAQADTSTTGPKAQLARTPQPTTSKAPKSEALEFPRRISRKPVLEPDAIPEKWR